MQAPPFTKIKEYNAAQLDGAVEAAVDYCAKNDLNFWELLKGIDAYFERRRRKEELEQAAKAERTDHDYFGHKD